MKYKVIASANPKEFTDEINACLQEGWQPQGGLCTFRRYTQLAGVKKEEDSASTYALFFSQALIYNDN
jgi:hypothetical protein